MYYFDEKKLINFLIMVCILLIIIINYTYLYDDTDWFTSNVDGKAYRVRNGRTDIKQIKSNLLANLNKKLNFIIENLSNEENKTTEVDRLITKWNRGIVIKEIGRMETDAAYVINKKYLSLCLKNLCNYTSCNNTIDNINLLTYVGIHEMAHIMSEEIGHGDEFKSNFKFLLDYSKKLNIYDPILKKEYPVYIELVKLNTPESYCGVSIINSIN